MARGWWLSEAQAQAQYTKLDWSHANSFIAVVSFRSNLVLSFHHLLVNQSLCWKPNVLQQTDISWQTCECGSVHYEVVSGESEGFNEKVTESKGDHFARRQPKHNSKFHCLCAVQHISATKGQRCRSSFLPTPRSMPRFLSLIFCLLPLNAHTSEST